ncbi:MAG TPA: hypothetical protein VGK00_08360 [Anaerolineales bacterium]|jgi:hypothetical protein
MKRPSDRSLQIIIIVVLVLAAITVNVIALGRGSPAAQVKTPTLVVYSPPPSATFSPIDPRKLPSLEPSPSATITTTPAFFLSTPLGDRTMVPVLQMTELRQMIATALKQTAVQLPTDFALETQYAATASYEQTKTADSPCPCDEDSLDCSDFYYITDAQLCYNACIRLGKGDVHHLDPNGDGIACRTRK